MVGGARRDGMQKTALVKTDILAALARRSRKVREGFCFINPGCRSRTRYTRGFYLSPLRGFVWMRSGALDSAAYFKGEIVLAIVRSELNSRFQQFVRRGGQCPSLGIGGIKNAMVNTANVTKTNIEQTRLVIDPCKPENANNKTGATHPSNI